MIIGIIGGMHVGKSTVANLIMESMQGDSVIIPFAGPLKDEARKFGWDGKKDLKGRKFLQVLGTEIGRAYDEMYWVKKWDERVMCTDSEIIISDDVRFENEINAVKRLGGVIIKIKGKRRKSEDLLRMPIKKFWRWVKSLFLHAHASEKGFPDSIADHVINNDGDMDRLREQIKELTNILTLTGHK